MNPMRLALVTAVALLCSHVLVAQASTSAGLIRHVRMWGHDGWGQIGVGTSGSYYKEPTKVTALANVAAVYLGGAHSFAVRADGTFWIWGFRYQGQGVLGKDLHVPTRLDLPC